MRVVLWIILAVCILAAGVFGYFLFSELIVDMQSQSFFNNMASDIEFRTGDGSPGGGVGGAGANASQWEGFFGLEWEPFLDFEALNEIYPGVVGWIELEGTIINFPVMQHTDNTFFLYHLPDGTRNRSGSIYLDYRNESDFSDEMVLIFGHHFSGSDAMFSILRNYRNQDFLDENPIIHLYTPYADYIIEIFASNLAHAVRDHPPLRFSDDDDFLSYVRDIRSRSFIQSDVEISADDRIVSLVTCQRDFANARLLVFGRLVRVGGFEVDVIGAP